MLTPITDFLLYQNKGINHVWEISRRNGTFVKTNVPTDVTGGEYLGITELADRLFVLHTGTSPTGATVGLLLMSTSSNYTQFKTIHVLSDTHLPNGLTSDGFDTLYFTDSVYKPGLVGAICIVKIDLLNVTVNGTNNVVSEYNPKWYVYGSPNGIKYHNSFLYFTSISKIQKINATAVYSYNSYSANHTANDTVIPKPLPSTIHSDSFSYFDDIYLWQNPMNSIMTLAACDFTQGRIILFDLALPIKHNQLFSTPIAAFAW